MKNERARHGEVDFWRGFVLLCIFVNHIPGNLLEDITPRNFGLSDASEAFVFLSGLSLAMASWSRPATVVTKRCVLRAFHLYRVHLVMTFTAISLFAVLAVLTDRSDLLQPDGRATVFDNTPQAIAGIVSLGHQLGYFNILPLYIVLMLWAPLPLILARVSLPLTLLASLLVYGIARLGDLGFPSWPDPGGWYFNPFAWQLTFTIGILAGIALKGRELPYSKPVFVFSGIVLSASLFVLKDGFGLVPGLWDAVRSVADVAKQDEGVFRLSHFLMLSYLIYQLRLGSSLAGTRLGREVERVGRYGLPVFVAGSLMSAFGQTIMTLVDGVEHASPPMVGMIYTLVGSGGLVLLARYLEWKSSLDGQALARFRSAAPSSPG